MYRVIPYVAQNGQTTVPDEVLGAVWDELETSGRARTTWYNGGVQDLATFKAFLSRPGTLPAFVAEPGRICFLGWLTEVRDRAAKVHFCALGPFKRGAGRALLAYWDAWRHADGGPLLRVLVGMTPETYEPALRVATILGFTLVGTVPQLCNLTYENRRVGGVISYREGV